MGLAGSLAGLGNLAQVKQAAYRPMLKPVDRLRQLPTGGRAEQGGGQPSELGGQAFALPGDVTARHAGIDPLDQLAAVAKDDHHL